MADGLKDLLDLDHKTWSRQLRVKARHFPWDFARTDMEDGGGQLDVAKVTGASLDILLAGAAGVHAIDGTELGVVETLLTRPLVVLVHGLGVDDVYHAHGLDLLWGEQAELDLLDGPERTFRYCWRAGRHIGGIERRWWWGSGARGTVLWVWMKALRCAAGGHTGLLVRVLEGV
jgi:hypothetical protein